MKKYIGQNLSDFISIFSIDHKKKYYLIIFLMFLSLFFELLFLKSVYSSLNFFTESSTENDCLIQFLRSYEDQLSMNFLILIR